MRRIMSNASSVSLPSCNSWVTRRYSPGPSPARPITPLFLPVVSMTIICGG
ncbi:MAG: hypothetical protein V9E87_16955 [Gemmatimonadales bacterium]